MRTLYWVSAITILGSTAMAGCEVGGDGWRTSRGSGDGGAAPQLSTTSASTGRPSATTVASTSTIVGSTAMTTVTGGGPIPVPAADE